MSYGAAGVIRDQVTGEPIAGATIAVLDAHGVSAADGRFRVAGSRLDTCNVDYLYRIHVQADGYKSWGLYMYTSSTFPTLTIELEPGGSGEPMPTPTPPHSAPTSTVCPRKTACPDGEHPLPCPNEPCGLHCGCTSCPACAPGEIADHHANFCRCIDPRTPSPTPSPLPHYDLTIALYSRDSFAADVNNNGDGTLTAIVGIALTQSGGMVSGGGFEVEFQLNPPLVGASISSPSHPYAPLPCSVNFPVYRVWGFEILACLRYDVALQGEPVVIEASLLSEGIGMAAREVRLPRASETPLITGTPTPTPTCMKTPACQPCLHAICGPYDQHGCARECVCEGPTPVFTCTPGPVCLPPTRLFCQVSCSGFQCTRCECVVDVPGTPTDTPFNPPAASATPAACPGDCDAGGSVSVNELVRGVFIMLGGHSVDGCGALDRNADRRITIDELVTAVDAALNGCGDRG